MNYMNSLCSKLQQKVQTKLRLKMKLNTECLKGGLKNFTNKISLVNFNHLVKCKMQVLNQMLHNIKGHKRLRNLIKLSHKKMLLKNLLKCSKKDHLMVLGNLQMRSHDLKILNKKLTLHSTHLIGHKLLTYFKTELFPRKLLRSRIQLNTTT